jgi:hemerythrin
MDWSDDFLIGIDVIDRQHKHIFELLLKIEQAVANGESWNSLRFLIIDVSEYLKFHLAVEEAMLEIVDYGELAKHKQSHERLTDAMGHLEERVHNSKGSDDLLTFFRTWFIEHVLKDDVAYAEEIKARLSKHKTPQLPPIRKLG